MIPAIIPPLTGLSVLITRPASQAATLASAINASGGEAILWPTIAIEPLTACLEGTHDLVIFVSVNAVEHGAHLITRSPGMRIAAIGKATAAALEKANLAADIVPAGDFTSEALLSHPQLDLATHVRVLIVRGVGGRETLQQAFTARGLSVSTLEVYRRVLPVAEPAIQAALIQRWRDEGIDIVTATSVETLRNLVTMFGAALGRRLFRSALLVISPRIAEAAQEMGFSGDIIRAPSADDAAIFGTLTRWQTRARVSGSVARQNYT